MTTLISNVTQLQNWLNAPSGTGQLTTSITINAISWTVPTGILTSGMILDGNFYTIFLENTTGNRYNNWPGLLKINGGTVKNLKISGSPSNNAQICPGGQLNSNRGSSYLSSFYNDNTNVTTYATYDTVWFDGCEANYLVFANFNASNETVTNNISIFGGSGKNSSNQIINTNITLINCQIGRNKSNPITKIQGQYAGFAFGPNVTFTVTNCVFYIQYGRFNSNNSRYLNDLGAICGSAGSGTVSDTIIYANFSKWSDSNTNNAVVFGGLEPGALSISNSYIFVDWALSLDPNLYYIPAIIYQSVNTLTVTTSPITVENVYVLITTVGSGSFTLSQPVMIDTQDGAQPKTLNYVGYTRGFPYTTRPSDPYLTITNSINTYTDTTPNTSLPVSGFSSSNWNLTYTPPLLNFNSISPWDSTSTIYNAPNSLLFNTTSNPIIVWNPSPSTITYPTPLSGAQLNAQAFKLDGITPVSGSFVYTPPSGTVLNAGLNQVLQTSFTSSDPGYNNANANTTVSVQNSPVITWTPVQSTLYYPEPLGSDQLNAEAFEIDGTTPLSGTFTYTPPSGTVLSLGNGQVLNTTFTSSNPLYANGSGNTTVDVISPTNVPVITWTPAISTVLYPAPLGSSQLNAQAFETDGVTPLPGTFTYTPPAGTVLNTGNGQVISTSFQADDYSYVIGSANTTINVVPAPYTFIFNQDDLYKFLYLANPTTYVKGILYNSIDIDVQTWVTDRSSLPRSFGAGRILDGNGHTIRLINNLTNPWYGLIYMGGGKVVNLVVDRTTDNNMAPVSGYGIVAGQNESGIFEYSVVASYKFDLTIVGSTNCGIFVGSGGNFTFNSCQVGTLLSPLNVGVSNTGLYASTNFQGSFNNCLSYITHNGSSTGFNGGFIASTGGSVSFTKCKAQGTMYDTTNGIQGGYVGVANHTVSFDNSYSIVNVSGVSGSRGGGFVGGGTNTNTQLYFNNCYYYGTAGTSGTLVNANTNAFVISLYNVTTNGAYLSSASVNTNEIKNMVIQPWDNNLSQIGVSAIGGANIFTTVKLGTDIYIGGNFTSVNGDSSIQYLARWDTISKTWNQVGGGAINNAVNSLAVLSSTLYIGGAFTSPSNRITTWNGTSFVPISIGDTFNGSVFVVYPENVNSVFIGGGFTLMNGVTTMRHIARWNGSAWTEPNNGLDNDVYSIIGAGSAGTVYVGGKFQTTGNASKTLNRISYYDGSVFQSIGSATDANAGVSSDVNTLVLSGSTLYMGGKFQNNNLPTPTQLNRWAQWDTSSLTNPISVIGTGTIGFNDDVYQIIVNGSILYVVGNFSSAGSNLLNNRYIARYDSSSAQPWSSVSNFFNGPVRSILYDASEGVYWVGGDFTTMVDENSNTVISNLNRIAQITETYNKTDYTGTSSTSTIPVLDFNNYFTS